MRDSWWINVPWEVLWSLVAAILLVAAHLILLSGQHGNNIHNSTLDVTYKASVFTSERKSTWRMHQSWSDPYPGEGYDLL